MYTKEIKLNHNEIPAKVNTETGEITEVRSRPNNIPEGKEIFIKDEYFSKNYERAWLFLVENLTPTEIGIAVKMSLMTELNTNSLNPLDDNTSIRQLAEYFKISTKSVKKTFSKLFKLGVYASFHYCHYKRGEVKEWIFNPYISFKGRLINSDIKYLFDDTEIGRLFNTI